MPLHLTTSASRGGIVPKVARPDVTMNGNMCFFVICERGISHTARHTATLTISISASALLPAVNVLIACDGLTVVSGSFDPKFFRKRLVHPFDGRWNVGLLSCLANMADRKAIPKSLHRVATSMRLHEAERDLHPYIVAGYWPSTDPGARVSDDGLG